MSQCSPPSCTMGRSTNLEDAVRHHLNVGSTRRAATQPIRPESRRRSLRPYWSDRTSAGTRRSRPGYNRSALRMIRSINSSLRGERAARSASKIGELTQARSRLSTKRQASIDIRIPVACYRLPWTLKVISFSCLPAEHRDEPAIPGYQSHSLWPARCGWHIPPPGCGWPGAAWPGCCHVVAHGALR